VFQDRMNAGRRLAEALEDFRDQDPVVLGIPRGGVIVAAEVAAALGCEMDLVILRKIGAPGNPELALGATAGADRVIWNEPLVAELDVSKDYLEEAAIRENEEVERRRHRYLGDKAAVDVADRTVLLVDDGLATGYTALAAARAVRAAGPASLVLALPVGPAGTVARLRGEVDELVCLSTPEPFFAVGQFYAEFAQVTDEEVVAKMRERRAA